MNKFVAIILASALLQNINAQMIKSPQELSTPPEIPLVENNKYEESTLRRAEVVFLISFPFTAILSFMALNGFYFITEPKYSFKMTILPPEVLPFSIVSALFSSGMIAYGDYVVVQKKKEDEQKIRENSGLSPELKFGVTLEKKF